MNQHLHADLTQLPVHLGRGGTAALLPDFGWDEPRLARYAADTASDGPDGRLVTMFEAAGSWEHWERHPAGSEVVIACSGRHRFTQEFDDGPRTTELTAGQVLINPPGVWHTATSPEPGRLVVITPGQGTEHRPL